MSGDPIERLILQLGRLPGIGERSAARLAYHIIKKSCGNDARDRGSHGDGPTLAGDLAQALIDVMQHVGLCRSCRTLSAQTLCPICSDSRRRASLLCVVEGVADQRALEASGAFDGHYFVLHGALAPLDGTGPDDLRLGEVIQRAEQGEVTEVILATNNDVEGDATALFLAQALRQTQAQVTRIASGVPLGGELEYLDAVTLGRALSLRRPF